MIAITGSHGFVGQALLQAAARQGVGVRVLTRGHYGDPEAYRSCRAVIHLAGLAHRKPGQTEDYEGVNHQLCMEAARAARVAGVSRFVFVSSSKALRDFSTDERALGEDTPVRPGCDYGRSKQAAEQSLLALGREGPMVSVVARPALIIGAPAKANLATLKALASSGLAPLAQIAFDGFTAKRSVTGLGNFIDALWVLCEHPLAAGQIFHVVEDKPVTAGQLFKGLRRAAQGDTTGAATERRLMPDAMQHPGWTSRAIASLLRGGLPLVGRAQTLDALDKPFVLDGQKMQSRLDWHPRHALEAELQQIMTYPRHLGDDQKG